MENISLEEAIALSKDNQMTIIDVRTEAEYREHSIEGSVNISSSANFSAFEPYRNTSIALICQSGQRAKTVAKKLMSSNFSNVYVTDKHMQSITKDKIMSYKLWSVDRQFRMTLGLLLLIFLLGSQFISSSFVIIPTTLCAGLIFTSLIDRCYLRMLIASLPWNKNNK